MHVTITYLLISSHFFLPYLRIRFNDDYPYAFGILIVYHSTFCGCMWCKRPIGLSNYVVINYWDLKQIPHKLGSVNDETVSLESRMWAESELMHGLLDNCLPFDHKCVWFQFNLKHSKKKNLHSKYGHWFSWKLLWHYQMCVYPNQYIRSGTTALLAFKAISVTVCPTTVIVVLSFAPTLFLIFSFKMFLVFKQMFESLQKYFAILLKFHHLFTLLYLKYENLNNLFCT